MENHYQVIDQATWPRAMHCAVFRRSVEPCFCVTFALDVTAFLTYVRHRSLSFTLAMVYAACHCANEVEALRYRFLDGQVVCYERIHTAFTYLRQDTGLFKVVNVPLTDTLESYVALARHTAQAQTEYFTGPLGNDVFQCSPLPWIHYQHISHTISGKQEQSTPLFDWGRYEETQGRVTMPFSVQAHHSFVDGLHVGQLALSLQAYLDSFAADEKENGKYGNRV